MKKIFDFKKRLIPLTLINRPSKFIKSPYVLEGIIHGLIGFVLSSLFIFISFNLFSSFAYEHFLAQSLVTSISLKVYILINLIFGVILGFISSNLATSNYLE